MPYPVNGSVDWALVEDISDDCSDLVFDSFESSFDKATYITIIPGEESSFGLWDNAKIEKGESVDSPPLQSLKDEILKQDSGKTIEYKTIRSDLVIVNRTLACDAHNKYSSANKLSEQGKQLVDNTELDAVAPPPLCLPPLTIPNRRLPRNSRDSFSEEDICEVSKQLTDNSDLEQIAPSMLSPIPVAVPARPVVNIMGNTIAVESSFNEPSTEHLKQLVPLFELDRQSSSPGGMGSTPNDRLITELNLLEAESNGEYQSSYIDGSLNHSNLSTNVSNKMLSSDVDSHSIKLRRPRDNTVRNNPWLAVTSSYKKLGSAACINSELGKQQVKMSQVKLPGNCSSPVISFSRPPRRRVDAGLNWETSARLAPRNVVVVIRNRSTSTLTLHSSGWRLDSGLWSEKPPLLVSPNTEARFGCESHSWFSAIVGDVRYDSKRTSLIDEGGEATPLGLVSFKWENAVIGGNSYSSSQPDMLACHFAGGDGSNCTVMFTLTDRAQCIHRATVLGEGEVALRLKEESERRRSSSFVGGSLLGFDISIGLPESLQSLSGPDLKTIVMRCPYCCCELVCPIDCVQFECGGCGSILTHTATRIPPALPRKKSIDSASSLRKILE